MSSFCARYCNSQWPLETQTEQMWLRSVSNNSMIERRYFCKRSELVVTSMPSCTGVTHAAISLGVPFTSTRHRRHAPIGDSPFNSHNVGMKILFWRATSRIVSSGRALTSRSSIFRVLTLLAGLIVAPPARHPDDSGSYDLRPHDLIPDDRRILPPGIGPSRCALCLRR